MLGDILEHSGFISVTGPPNSGKSTFLNKLLGRKISIVTEKAQTTRNRILGIQTTENSQLVFTDTPGITETSFGKVLNRWMNRFSFSAARDADIILFFVDTSVQHPENGMLKDEKYILSKLPENSTAILVVNKCDKVKPKRIEDTAVIYSRAFKFKNVFTISAKTGDGIPELMEGILSLIPEGPQYFPKDDITDQEDNFIISEIIREKAFSFLHQELPYSITVITDSVKHEENLITLHASIHAARKSQKGMIIGKKGKMLKKIGSAARLELEEIFEKKVMLNLYVRVEEKWNEKENLMIKMGFTKDF